MTAPGAPAAATVEGAQVVAATHELLGTGGLAPAPSPGTGLGKTAAAGFLLMSAQSVASRVITLAAQIALARILGPTEFGLYGMAMAVAGYANLVLEVGVRQVLVARGKRFPLWANVGFWVAAATGLASAAFVAIAAPMTAAFFKEPALIGIMLVIAVSQPFLSLVVAYEARLQVDLRFRMLSLLQFINAGLLPILQVAGAFLSMGAYAFVVPRAVVGLIRLWMARKAAPICVRRDPQFKHWKHVLRPGGVILLTNVAYLIGPTAPVFILGRLAGTPEVGYFNFAFSLSAQALWLLGSQLDMVLFPTLGRMVADPARQHAAFVRACRALAAAMVPLCLFQTVAADPIIRLVFGPKWESAIVPFQFLSIGILVAGALVPAQSLLQAQGRFATKLRIAVVWAAIGALACGLGVILGGPAHALEGASLGLALGFIGGGIHNCVSATRPLGGGWMDVVRILVPPLLAGLAASGAALAAAPLAPGQGWALHSARICILGTVGGLVYAALVRTFVPRAWDDFLGAATPVLKLCGVRRRARAGDPPA